MAEIHPDTQLLLYCARPRMEPEITERVRSLVHPDTDWDYLAAIALRHALVPILYHNLRTACRDVVPSNALDQFRGLFKTNATNSLFLTAELLEILNVFQAHGISVIPYKGPVLAASLYRNVLLRQFGDLDLLVRECDYQRAQDLLIARKYELNKQYDWESSFIDTSKRVKVDLHKRMTPPEFPAPLHFDYLWKRLQPLTLAGSEVPNLCPEDTLLMLAVQIAKDSGKREFQLAKICDMAQLLRVCRLDLGHCLKQARRLGGERMLLYSLLSTHYFLGTPLSQQIIFGVVRQRALDEAVERFRQQLFHRENTTSVVDERTLKQFHQLMRERLRDKLSSYYVRYIEHVITPCVLDRRFLHLPNQLAFLYYFIRPIRLVGKHGLASVLGAVNWGTHLLPKRLREMHEVRTKSVSQ